MLLVLLEIVLADVSNILFCGRLLEIVLADVNNIVLYML